MVISYLSSSPITSCRIRRDCHAGAKDYLLSHSGSLVRGHVTVSYFHSLSEPRPHSRALALGCGVWGSKVFFSPGAGSAMGLGLGLRACRLKSCMVGKATAGFVGWRLGARARNSNRSWSCFRACACIVMGLHCEEDMVRVPRMQDGLSIDPLQHSACFKLVLLSFDLNFSTLFEASFSRGLMSSWLVQIGA